MSGSEGHGHGNAPLANVEQGGEQGVGAALSINEILEAVVERLAASERRQADAIEAMHARIAELSKGAVADGEQVPPRLRTEFDRLQQAVTRLLSTTTHTAEHDADGKGPASSVGAASETDVGNSALHATGQRQQPPARPGLRDPFEFADFHTAGNPDQPWDQDSAEELTRLYEQGVAGLPSASPPGSAVAVKTPQITAEISSAAGGASLPAANEQVVPPRIEPEIEKKWLEDRFAEVAVRIESILATERQQAPLQAFDERFSSLEDRLSSAVGDLATRSDVAGLSEVEACIAEMAMQLEQTHLELARVAELEEQVRELAERVSEERLAALTVSPGDILDPHEVADVVAARLDALGLGAASSAPALDAQEIATIVAERLAEERSQDGASQAASLDHRQFDELKDLIGELAEKRREEGDHASTILETVQQAMMRLLDRMDSLEQNAQSPGYAARPAAPRRDATQSSPDQEPAPAAAIAPPPSPVATARPDADAVPPLMARPPEPAAEIGGHPAAKALDGPAEPASFEDDAQPSARPSGLSLDDYHPRRDDAGSHDEVEDDDADAAVEADENPHRDRRHFMEAARRAAQQANERARAAAEDNAKPKRKRGKSTPYYDSNDPDGTGAGGTEKSAAAKRRIVVAAIAVLLIGAGASALMIKSSGLIQRHLMAPQTQNQEMLGHNGTGQPAPAKAPTAIAPVKDGNANSGPAKGSEVYPVGVRVTPTGGPVSPEELARRQRHQQYAIWSSDVGSKLTPADKVPAALVPSEVNPQPRASVTDGTPAQRTTGLPSALVGPLSLRIAAANGDPSAEFEVGARYAEGKGPEQDFKQAITWYRRSATRGFALAQYRLATLYERGLGVAADPARAKIWYQRAADQGNVKAMHNLAVLAAGTASGKPDYGAAARWFEQAAERGLGDSQFNLAILYQSGLGVKRDMVQSYIWFGVAAKRGDKAAQQRQKDVARQLSATELTTADRVIATWREKATSRLANNPHYAGEQWKQRARSNN